jgi:ATPase subunit of ABC transporter with duplicated ATPase domains
MQKRIDKMEVEKTFVSRGSGLSLQIDTDFLKARQAFIFERETIYSPDHRALFNTDVLNFRPGDRVALLGINGSGKSSCIESLMRSYKADVSEQTTTRFNPNLRIGYFDQGLAQFDVPLGILDWVREHCSAREETIKRSLIQWGFPFAEQSRRVNVLSGGERARLMLMTFQLDQPNLLIMDEPTNHIDLQGKEELESDLQQTGISLLFTSHDQRFIENIATRFWWIHEAQLVEIHDPSLYFDSMNDLSTSPIGSSGSDMRSQSVDLKASANDEDALLERVCRLEQLLDDDRTRKPKFQKLKLQQQWQSELDRLMELID